MKTLNVLAMTAILRRYLGGGAARAAICLPRAARRIVNALVAPADERSRFDVFFSRAK